MERPVSGLESYWEWQERVKRFESSRVSVDAFCEQENVSRSKFVDWLLILKQKPRPVAVDQEVRKESADSSAFVPISPNGSLLRLPVRIDQAVLLAVVHVISTLPKESPT